MNNRIILITILIIVILSGCISNKNKCYHNQVMMWNDIEWCNYPNVTHVDAFNIQSQMIATNQFYIACINKHNINMNYFEDMFNISHKCEVR